MAVHRSLVFPPSPSPAGLALAGRSPGFPWNATRREEKKKLLFRKAKVERQDRSKEISSGFGKGRKCHLSRRKLPLSEIGPCPEQAEAGLPRRAVVDVPPGLKTSRPISAAGERRRREENSFFFAGIASDRRSRRARRRARPEGPAADIMTLINRSSQTASLLVLPPPRAAEIHIVLAESAAAAAEVDGCRQTMATR